MILHAGILALLSGSLITLLVMLAACFVAFRILRSWNINSSGEEQLLLERKTWLVSSLLNYALAFQVISVFLFVFTAEDIHSLFIGAMCATGALNANLVGWLVLLLKGFLLFVSGFWVLLNVIDQNTEDTPLVRLKYRLLLIITPLVALDLYLQWRYFIGLQPEVITSCCGSLFSSQGDGVAADLVGMPVIEAMLVFSLSVFCYLVFIGLCFFFRAAVWRHLLFAASLIMFFVALGAIVSFISPYIYQMPSHHCPFDMLQANYYFVGYPIYIGLFASALFGMAPGLFEPLRVNLSINEEIVRRERVWLLISVAGFVLFILFPLWQMLFGSFKLLGY